jgi:GNAT superfamily N-acetyltransferase
MTLREKQASGLDCVRTSTDLLHRVRLAQPTAGVWEAADVQWWWRRPRSSDSLEQPFWIDDDGPVAMAMLTDWGDRWQIDPFVVPRFIPEALPVAIERAVALSAKHDVHQLEVMADDDDKAMLNVLGELGFSPGPETNGIAWMEAVALADTALLPDGYRLTDRSNSPNGPHWLGARNGPNVEARLRQTSLYDPHLDLAVYTFDGDLASYALLWFDPVTSVGMIEPMRTQDGHQRRGLGRAILSIGLGRLVDRGASRLKVGFGTEAARGLYTSLGFQPTQTTRVHRPG